MLQDVPISNVSDLVVLAGIIAGSFAVVNKALEFAATTVRAKFKNGKGDNPGTYSRRDQILSDLHEIVMEPGPTPGDKMVWRETGLVRKIDKLANSIDSLAVIIKDVRSASMEAVSEAREARTISENIWSKLKAS